MNATKKQPKHVLVLHGPNLNMLGKREPGIYGSQTLADIENELTILAKQNNVHLESFQSNAESALIDRIHQSYDIVDFIIINPAAYTHTSVALRDALLSVGIPYIEVHLSNVYKREAFRKHSYFSDKAIAVISGCGSNSYIYALQHAISSFNEKHS